MRLSEKQKLFTRLLPKLINYAHRKGYEITLGDAYRDPRVFGKIGKKKGYGKKYSNHKSRLAIDLNLFKNGRYLTKTSDHKLLGEYWEKLHPLTCWGGRFDDGNHYSLEHEGRK
ncbi:MAG: M15 family metallopeptidase [Ketobacter sp.]|nr:M15 family metallopeptidase [Ketobacter sp.]